MFEHLNQLAVHAYYAGELDAGRRACDRLLARELPADKERVVRRNRTWYTQPLSELLPCAFHQVDIDPADDGWSLFNPSIVAYAGAWLLNVRSSNYRIVDGRYVMPHKDGGCIRTKNILVWLNKALGVTADLLASAKYATTEYPVDGLEDVRLNVVDGEVLASATVRNFAPLDGTCRIGTAILNTQCCAFEGISCRDTPADKHEKNWMPLLGRRQWLYAANHCGHVCTVEPADALWAVRCHAESPHCAKAYRGGSQLIPVGEGKWLCIVHEVAMEDDGRRVYEHRFVAFDEPSGFSICGVSPVFAFRELRAIEFCAGLAASGDRLVASFGVRDAEAWLVEISLRDVLGMLVPA